MRCMVDPSGTQLGMLTHTVAPSPAGWRRYGTVEVAAKIDTGSRVPGRLLSQRVRSILVWLHLSLINAVTIGELEGC